MALAPSPPRQSVPFTRKLLAPSAPATPLFANPSFRPKGVGTFHACVPLRANLCLSFASCLHHRRQHIAHGCQSMLSLQVLGTIGVGTPLQFQSVPFTCSVSALLAPAYPRPLWCRLVPFQPQGVGNIGSSAPLQSVNSAQRLAHPKPRDTGAVQSPSPCSCRQFSRGRGYF